MSTITHVSLALPPFKYSAQEIVESAAPWLAQNVAERDLFARFVSSSAIQSRYFSMPVEKILGLTSVAERANLFQEFAIPLGSRAVALALRQTDLGSSDVRQLVFTSCSVPSVPAIDAAIVNNLNLSPTLRRLPIYQHGCAGGAVGLGLACRNLGQDRSALVLATELCSLVFQRSDFSGGNLVGSALFGDGAACAVVEAQGKGLEYQNGQSYLIPHTESLMGYDLLDDGAHLRLQRELPMVLAQEGPRVVKEFLQQQGLAVPDIKAWLFHPGGVKILNALEEKFGLDRSRTHWAWDVLAKYGNMSSATILFVLAEFLQGHQCSAGDPVFVMGVGPGLTLELLLFSYR